MTRWPERSFVRTGRSGLESWCPGRTARTAKARCVVRRPYHQGSGFWRNSGVASGTWPRRFAPSSVESKLLEGGGVAPQLWLPWIWPVHGSCEIVAPRGNPGVAPRAVALRLTAPRTWHLLGLCGCHSISRFFGERGAPSGGGSCASLTLFVTTRSTDAQDPTGAFPGVWVKEGTSPSAIDVLLRAAAAVWSQCPAEFSLFQERSAAQARAVGSHQQLAVTVKYGRLVQAHGLRWRPVTLLPHQSSGVGFACSAYTC